MATFLGSRPLAAITGASSGIGFELAKIAATEGYDLVIPLDRLNLVTGPNGSGKSNLYRALRLLADTAQGQVIPSLAREGGLQSTLWAGPETFSRSVVRGEHPVQGAVRKKPVSIIT